MPTALVFGASGAIGRFLLPRLLAAGWEVVAVSRTPHASASPRVRWIEGDLYRAAELARADVVFSLGPLDGCARWLAATSLRYPRLVAIGSQSAETKSGSADADERALAQRLRDAESALADAAAARDCAWTVLRPTLIYGAGLDRSLTPIARFAARWRVMPIVDARGLRQPVHADDIAAACIALADRPATSGRVYAIGGGERLAFGEMIERVRASLPVASVALRMSPSFARFAATLARAAGFVAASAGAVARLGEDLVVDDASARADFGWSPRAFAPDAGTWTPPPLP